MKKRLISILLCMTLFLINIVPTSAEAVGRLYVMLKYEDMPVAGASFQIYKAAEMTEDGMTLAEQFSNYRVSMVQGPNSDEWKALASTLAVYAAADKLEPFDEQQTDESGMLCFEGLSDGVYLVTGSPVIQNDILILPQAVLVTVPYSNDLGETDYDVVASPKYISRDINGGVLERRALKIWDDENNTQSRPQEITVQLLCDGEVYDEKVLNEECDWGYTWNGLDPKHNWQITEKEVPDDYTVKITQQGTTFTITNTNDTSAPPPTKPDDPDLPYTGMLWLPVPILIAFGAVTLFIGILLIIKKEDTDE